MQLFSRDPNGEYHNWQLGRLFPLGENKRAMITGFDPKGKDLFVSVRQSTGPNRIQRVKRDWFFSDEEASDLERIADAFKEVGMSVGDLAECLGVMADFIRKGLSHTVYEMFNDDWSKRHPLKTVSSVK